MLGLEMETKSFAKDLPRMQLDWSQPPSSLHMDGGSAPAWLSMFRVNRGVPLCSCVDSFDILCSTLLCFLCLLRILFSIFRVLSFSQNSLFDLSLSLSTLSFSSQRTVMLPAPGDLNDVAFIEYTSGSTGNPKSVATVQWRCLAKDSCKVRSI